MTLSSSWGAIAGDYDQDGDVDADDYQMYKAQNGGAIIPGTGADGSGDGSVNLGDYTLWRDNLGSGVVIDFEHGFAGGRMDTITGRIHFRHRDYDPQQMRWNERDPIGFAAGDLSLFRYVGNRPLSKVDPSGLVDWLGGINEPLTPLWQQYLSGSGGLASNQWGQHHSNASGSFVRGGRGYTSTVTLTGTNVCNTITGHLSQQGGTFDFALFWDKDTDQEGLYDITLRIYGRITTGGGGGNIDFKSPLLPGGIGNVHHLMHGPRAGGTSNVVSKRVTLRNVYLGPQNEELWNGSSFCPGQVVMRYEPTISGGPVQAQGQIEFLGATYVGPGFPTKPQPKFDPPAGLFPPDLFPPNPILPPY